MKRALIVTALLAAVWIPVWGRSDTPLDAASIAWDRGDYTTALKLYLEILDSPGASAASRDHRVKHRGTVSDNRDHA